MAKVEITRSLLREIERQFKGNAGVVFDLIESLAEHPKKGKDLAVVGGIAIKEVRYEGFRFYCIVDAYAIRFRSEAELVQAIIRFVRMSDKKHQQQVVDDMKRVLREIGPKGFSE